MKENKNALNCFYCNEQLVLTSRSDKLIKQTEQRWTRTSRWWL